MKKRIIFSVIIMSLIATSCSMKKLTINSTGLFMEDVVQAFFEEGDLEFAEEAAPANLKLLDGLIKGSDYENDGLLLKGCKLYAMYAMGFIEDTETQRRKERAALKRASKFYEKAKDYGLKVLSRNPDFRNAVNKGPEEFTKVLQAFGKDDVPALFWAGFAWGSYINLNRNKTKAIANLPKAKALIDRVMELDDTYFYGLPHLFMIVYYSMPKMFGGDPEKAKAEYDRIKEISGDKFILAEFFMAKNYAVQVQDRKLFDEMLEIIEDADDDIIPEELFTAVAKAKAEVLNKKRKDLF